MNTSPMPHYTEMNNVVQERNYPHLSFSLLLSFIYTQNVMDCKIVKITTYLVLTDMAIPARLFAWVSRLVR